ncbi:MAG: hypothetical protein CSA62_08020 [Planctomycetota bacterium]|nr:MAG: hypothetical protein CSA62_08020 [Planctomycetota bacterium]
MRRQILSFAIQGERCIGTCHAPMNWSPQTTLSTPLALVSFNYGQAPRSGHGALAAKLSDTLAALGIPAFRVDAPGLGDSTGVLPMREDHYWQQMELGEQLPFARDLLDRLQQKYGIESFLLSGLCGGAVTAIRTAAEQTKRVLGLVLLEPTFLLTRSAEELRARRILDTKTLDDGLLTIRARLFSPRSWGRAICGRSKTKHHLGVLWQSAIRSASELLGKTRLPEDSNLDLIERWQRTLGAQIPTLLFAAGGGPLQAQARRVYERVLSARERSWVQWETLPGANHTLTTGEVHPIVQSVTLDWIRGRLGQAI